MRTNKSYRYRVVDVFTDKPLEGNPLAVFPDASGLVPDLMQKIAKELNLSETVFLFPSHHSECVAQIRIFTPGKEMDFAGHPTIGTAYILMDEGKVPKHTKHFAIEENVGPVAIEVDSGPSPKLWLKTPPLLEEDFIDAQIAAKLLGLSRRQLLDARPQILNAGNPTLFIPVAEPATVDKISFDTSEWARIKSSHPDPFCVFAFAPVPQGAYSRMFAPDYGIREDPATGSSTGSLASYMMKHSLISSISGTAFFSEQGTQMGRRSIIHVSIRGDKGVDGIAVGGNVTPVMDGTLTL